jgi:uncharacterized protein YecT (DUF1311 family)
MKKPMITRWFQPSKAKTALGAVVGAVLLISCLAAGFQAILVSDQLAYAADSSAPGYARRLQAIDAKLSSCLTKASGTSSRILDCYAAATEDADAVLEESYWRLLASVKENARYAQALQDEQRAWIRMRDEAVATTGDFAEIDATDRVASLEASRVAEGAHFFRLVRNRAEMMADLALTASFGQGLDAKAAAPLAMRSGAGGKR